VAAAPSASPDRIIYSRFTVVHDRAHLIRKSGSSGGVIVHALQELTTSDACVVLHLAG
jgi:hypothetical protein